MNLEKKWKMAKSAGEFDEFLGQWIGEECLMNFQFVANGLMLEKHTKDCKKNRYKT